MDKTDSRFGDISGAMFWALLVVLVFSACSEKVQPPEDWTSRIVAYKTPVSETGYAGYYTSYQEKIFLTLSQFESAIPGGYQWTKGENETWILNVDDFPAILNEEGPMTLHFKLEESPSGNTNVVLVKGVTEKYEIPWILLDQIVIQMGESFVEASA